MYVKVFRYCVKCAAKCPTDGRDDRQPKVIFRLKDAIKHLSWRRRPTRKRNEGVVAELVATKMESQKEWGTSRRGGPEV